MRSGWAWLVVGLGAVGSLGADEVAVPAEKLRVMTLNVRYAEARDGENRWEKRRDTVAALIAAEADVAGLQEVLAGQWADLQRGLEEFESFGRGRERRAEDGESCPIFYRQGRFERVGGGTFWLSDTPEEPGSRHWGNTLPRICTWVELRKRRDGATLWVFNLHLDHQSAEARRRGLALARGRADKAAAAGGAVVLLGDFNEVPDGLAVAATRGAEGWRDAWSEGGTGDGGTFNGWQAAGPYRRIDYVFYRGGGLGLRSVRVLEARTGPGGGWVSDHFPVAATFDWR